MIDEKYPIFKNNVAFIDHTVTVDDETEKAWMENGIIKIVSLMHGNDNDQRKEPRLTWELRHGINTESTAQWCIWKMLEWAYSQEPPIQIKGKKILIIGWGKIGKEIGNWLIPCRTIDKADFAEENEYKTYLQTVVPWADIIFLCIPHNNNESFWDKEKMGWMKPNAILISPSRPSVFSSSALFDKRVIWDKKHEAWRTQSVIDKKNKIVEGGRFE